VRGVRQVTASSSQEFPETPVGRYESLSHGRKPFSGLHTMVIVHGPGGMAIFAIGRYLPLATKDMRRDGLEFFENTVGARFWILRWRGPYGINEV
jgi:hypothetical protein